MNLCIDCPVSLGARCPPVNTPAKETPVQIMIDTNEEPKAGLVQAAKLILLAAGIVATEFFASIEGFHNAMEVAAGRPTPPPIRPDHRPAAPVVPLPPGNVPVAPVVHPEYHPDGKPPEVPNVPVGTPPPELAALFGGAGTGTPPVVATGPAFAPPAPSMTAGIASLVTTAPAAPSAGAPAADTPPASATTDPALASDRDSDYLPWDARIHSDTRKKNADGTWRNRRNLDPTVKAAVYAELMAAHGKQVTLPQPPAGVAGAMPVPAPAPPVPVQSVAAASVPAPPVPAAGAVSDNGAPAPPVSLQQGAVPVPPAPDVGVPNAANANVVPITSARVLTQKINTAQGAGLLTPAQVQEALTATGLDSITALFNQPAKVPEVDAYLRRWIA